MTKRIILLLFRFYQLVFASSLPTCRYRPTCSAYTQEAIGKYGFFYGGFLGLRRLLACHPFSKRSFYDPV